MNYSKYATIIVVSQLFIGGLAVAQNQPYATIGQVVRIDPQVNRLIPSDAKIEIIASGFGHLEGPVWVRDSSYLLVNETKAQTTYKWSPKTGLSKFVEHNGYTGRLPYSEEPGSNGMTVDSKGQLIVCDHGDRRIAAMPLRGKGGKRTLTDNAQGKRYSSPNDVVAHTNGSLYFSDPPYGLPQQDKDPGKETTVNGVYRYAPNGTVTLLIKDLALPNGLAFSADGKTLFVSQSDSTKPLIMAYPVVADGSVGKGRVFYDGSSLPKFRPKEVFDGLKTDRDGNLWTSGPGGLLIISPAGKLIGRIDTGEVISNCAWGDDGSTLYLASSMFLCRIKTNAKGILPGSK
ncbi:SMP-30/gluconolactonase/LRE family protein [Spirosoma oryzicola]|uniref:SMP-30/gluconolactonase/LRE family protein n=1 Tax=Spirosoma oryzicola TaxID=2898794 RepID=UPI001E2BB891|nr:SMP-30/gluconolactonase/LRE family protein [Spirosoma oryzicola]UHG89304.1 SMP-30/gluconolactonase/LRE family protein [Spirosoma oryzicola]